MGAVGETGVVVLWRIVIVGMRVLVPAAATSLLLLLLPPLLFSSRGNAEASGPSL